jgi:cysteine synthase A
LKPTSSAAPTPDPFPLPGLPGIELYFKDESSHPTGSLKHRLARSLFLYALCNGWLKPARR